MVNPESIDTDPALGLYPRPATTISLDCDGVMEPA